MKLKTIKDLMDKLAEDDMVFSNEQEFQFELAMRLMQLQNVQSVKLEAMSLDGYQNWSAVEKDIISLKSIKEAKKYTDIIVTEQDGERTAVELKYKTAAQACIYYTKHGPAVTMKQDACDFGCYDFIKDVCRLEAINTRLFQEDKKIDHGFAIILTNNANYRNNLFTRSKIWKNYSISENRKTIPSGELTFKNGSHQYQTTSMRVYNALVLKKPICLTNWSDYPLSNVDYNDYQIKKSSHPGFSYLIVER